MAVQKGNGKVRKDGGIRGYIRSTRSSPVAIAVTLPLLVLYNIGLMMPEAEVMNGADLLTRAVVALTGPKGFLILNGLLVLTSIVMIAVLIKKGMFRWGQWVALCVEGMAYGLLFGFLITRVLKEAHLLGATQKYSLLQAISISAGAGYWEEAVFRLLMVGGAISLGRRILKGRDGKGKFKVALVGFVAVLISSFAFSLLHFVGQEAFSAYAFWYRFLFGLAFALIFLVRGFAVSAYTHFIYDVFVML